jgi:hypothetical protein
MNPTSFNALRQSTRRCQLMESGCSAEYSSGLLVSMRSR